ncbi:MAG: cytochrome c [Longimicrobiales bacterium]|nr:cytochrome c [Longimicrobiales bacterium]
MRIPGRPSRALGLFLVTLAAGACDPGFEVDPGWGTLPLPEPGYAPRGDVADVGAALFRRNCVACHALGGGDGVGPDLRGVTRRRSIGWVRAMIARPDSMLRVDATAAALLRRYQVPMPNRRLDPPRVRAIVEFLWRADHAPDAPGA